MNNKINRYKIGLSIINNNGGLIAMLNKIKSMIMDVRNLNQKFNKKNPEFDKEDETHVDHHLQRAHESEMWNVYCPLKWVAGQRSGSSDVAHTKLSDGSMVKSTHTRRYWHPYNPNEGIDANKAEAYYLGDETPTTAP